MANITNKAHQIQCWHQIYNNTAGVEMHSKWHETEIDSVKYSMDLEHQHKSI